MRARKINNPLLNHPYSASWRGKGGGERGGGDGQGSGGIHTHLALVTSFVADARGIVPRAALAC